MTRDRASRHCRVVLVERHDDALPSLHVSRHHACIEDLSSLADLHRELIQLASRCRLSCRMGTLCSAQRRGARRHAVAAHVRRALATGKRQRRTAVHARTLRPLGGREGVRTVRRLHRQGAGHCVLDAAPHGVGFDDDAVEFERIGPRAPAIRGTRGAILRCRQRRRRTVATNHHHGLAGPSLGRCNDRSLRDHRPGNARQQVQGKPFRPARPAGRRRGKARAGRSRGRRHRASDRNRVRRSPRASGRGSARADRSRAW